MTVGCVVQSESITGTTLGMKQVETALESDGFEFEPQVWTATSWGNSGRLLLSRLVTLENRVQPVLKLAGRLPLGSCRQRADQQGRV